MQKKKTGDCGKIKWGRLKFLQVRVEDTVCGEESQGMRTYAEIVANKTRDAILQVMQIRDENHMLISQFASCSLFWATASDWPKLQAQTSENALASSLQQRPAIGVRETTLTHLSAWCTCIWTQELQEQQFWL